MDCFGTCFTLAQTSDVKPPFKHPRSPLQGFKPLSSLLEAPFKPPRSPLHLWKASSPLEARFKPSWSLPNPVQPPCKPPWSPLQAAFKPPRSSLQRWKLQAPFKPPWSSLECPFKPPWTFRRWSPLEAPLKPSEGEARFELQTFVPPAPSRPVKAASEGAPRNQPLFFYWRLSWKTTGLLLAEARVDLLLCYISSGLAAVGLSLCNGSWTWWIHQLRRGIHYFPTTMCWQSQRRCFFLLVAAWVDPGRNALQSAEQRC